LLINAYLLLLFLVTYDKFALLITVSNQRIFVVKRPVTPSTE